MGLHHECCRPLHLPVPGCHWWEAGQKDKQQLSSGRALWPRLRRRLHRYFGALAQQNPNFYLFLIFMYHKSPFMSRWEAVLFHLACAVFLPSVFVAVGSSISCGIGLYPNWIFFCGFVGMFMFFCAHWQTYVSGTLRFGLWVTHSALFFKMIITQPLFCSYMNPKLTTSSQGRRDGGADRHHHHVSDDGFRRSEPLAEHGNRIRRFVQSHLSTITVHTEEHFHSPWLYGPLVLTLNLLPHQFRAFSF